MELQAITSGQGVLLPDSTRKNRKQRIVTVAVNSRDRNTTTDPKSNNFRWTFRRPMKDVVSIELVSGCVPANLYNLNTGWNSLTFVEAAQSYSITLTPGQYTATELCAELQRALNAAGLSNTYTVSYTAITNKATITATGGADFSFDFASSPNNDIIDGTTGAIQLIGCPARLFGFVNQLYTSNTSATIAPPNRMDPNLFLQRMYLHLNADNSVDFHRIEMGAGRKDCFHIMYLDQVLGGYYTLNRDTYTPIYYSSPAPISRMRTLNISIRDEFHRLIDLGGQDLTLVFEISFLE